MPEPPDYIRLVEEVAAREGKHPVEAYDFLQQALTFTVRKYQGEMLSPEDTRHISGRQLCDGMLEYAHQRWGLMARAVLDKWNVRSTLDVGQMVFALVESGVFTKTDEDTLDDFRDVFNLAERLDNDYEIPRTLVCTDDEL